MEIFALKTFFFFGLHFFRLIHTLEFTLINFSCPPKFISAPQSHYPGAGPASVAYKLIFVILLYSPSCFGQETAKEPFGLRVKLPRLVYHTLWSLLARGGVKDTRLEAKAKDTKKIRGQGQGQPFRGQTLSRPRTGMLEAKAKDQGHKAQVLSKKKRSLQKFFRRSPKKKKKVFTKIFQAISTKIRFPKNFSSAPQNFNIPKNRAVLEPRTGQFSRT